VPRVYGNGKQGWSISYSHCETESQTSASGDTGPGSARPPSPCYGAMPTDNSRRLFVEWHVFLFHLHFQTVLPGGLGLMSLPLVLVEIMVRKERQLDHRRQPITELARAQNDLALYRRYSDMASRTTGGTSRKDRAKTVREDTPGVGLLSIHRRHDSTIGLSPVTGSTNRSIGASPLPVPGLYELSQGRSAGVGG
jgi:hypothetical protein